MAFSVSGSQHLVPPVASHRGHGFALGHPNFQLPSRHAPVNPRMHGRARSLTPEQLRGPGGRHGSAELGVSMRDRERDRPRNQRSQPGVAGGSTDVPMPPMTTVSATVGDPVQQATAYRSTPAGPQEAVEWNTALENVINRLVSIETAQRRHAQTISDHDIKIEHTLKHSEWLKLHVLVSKDVAVHRGAGLK